MFRLKYFLTIIIIVLVFLVCTNVKAQFITEIPDPNMNFAGIAAKARTGNIGYKAALGYVPLSKESNRIVNAFWDNWPTRTDIPFIITYDSSNNRLFFQIFIQDNIRTLIWYVADNINITCIRMNLRGEEKRNVTIKNLWINGVSFDVYNSGDMNRHWYFGMPNQSQIPFLTITGMINFASNLGTLKPPYKYPGVEFALGTPYP